MASKITKIIANFETQLASTITVSGTTGSLKSPVLDDDGVQAVSGKYVMCVDLGLSKEEHLLFDLDGLTGAMTNIKSISRQGAETVGALRQHRSGSKVALTNFANLLYISKILTGEVALDGLAPLLYDVAPTFSNALQLATKGYVDATISGSVGTAGEILHGTTRVSRDQGAKQKVRAVWAREQDTPDKTLKIESFKLAFTDKIFAYAGGNTPNFIDPAFGGDLGVALQPSNGETVTITVDGVATILTFVTSIGASAGNILIGASATTARANLVGFLNNPTVTSATQIAVTGTNLTAIQKLSSTDDLALNAFIRVTNPATTTFSVTETMAGAGNIWTVNSTKNRIDLVTLNSAGALTIRRGTEAVSPTTPTPTNGDVVICSVLNRVAQTTVRDYNLAGQAYITDWYDLSVYRTDVITSLPIFGSGSDGDVTISVDTTLTKDMNYNNLTINNTFTVFTAGYKVYVKGTLTQLGSGKFSANGGNGGNGGVGANGASAVGGTGGTAGSAGTGISAGSFPASKAGFAGGAGGRGGDAGLGSAAGVAGTNGAASTFSVTDASASSVAGTAGGGGGSNSGYNGNSGGAVGTAGTITSSSTKLIDKNIDATLFLVLNFSTNAITHLDFNAGNGGSSGGGGGGGGPASNSAGGGGGGAGGSGGSAGTISIFANNIVTTNTTLITANGGNGGNGGAGGVGFALYGSGGGGGAGGNGGNGGLIYIMYKSLTGTIVTTTTAGTGGTAGTFGTGASNGVAGTNGNNGVAGVTITRAI